MPLVFSQFLTCYSLFFLSLTGIGLFNPYLSYHCQIFPPSHIFFFLFYFLGNFCKIISQSYYWDLVHQILICKGSFWLFESLSFSYKLPFLFWVCIIFSYVLRLSFSKFFFFLVTFIFSKYLRFLFSHCVLSVCFVLDYFQTSGNPVPPNVDLMHSPSKFCYYHLLLCCWPSLLRFVPSFNLCYHFCEH